MKTFLRQDGSEVQLNEKDAANWLRMGLAVEKPIPKVIPKPSETQIKPKE